MFVGWALDLVGRSGGGLGRLLGPPIKVVMVAVAAMAVAAAWVTVEGRLDRMDDPGVRAAVLRSWGWIAALTAVLEVVGLAALWVVS